MLVIAWRGGFGPLIATISMLFLGLAVAPASQVLPSAVELDRLVLRRSGFVEHAYPADIPGRQLAVAVTMRIEVASSGRSRVAGLPSPVFAVIGEQTDLPKAAAVAFERAARADLERWTYEPSSAGGKFDVTLSYYPVSHQAARHPEGLARVIPVVPKRLAGALKGFAIRGVIEPKGTVTNVSVDGPSEVQAIARAAVEQWRYRKASGGSRGIFTIVRLAPE